MLCGVAPLLPTRLGPRSSVCCRRTEHFGRIPAVLNTRIRACCCPFRSSARVHSTAFWNMRCLFKSIYLELIEEYLLLNSCGRSQFWSVDLFSSAYIYSFYHFTVEHSQAYGQLMLRLLVTPVPRLYRSWWSQTIKSNSAVGRSSGSVAQFASSCPRFGSFTYACMLVLNRAHAHARCAVAASDCNKRSIVFGYVVGEVCFSTSES
jgi:hypothetical protein